MSDDATKFMQDGASIQVEMVGTVEHDYEDGWDIVTDWDRTTGEDTSFSGVLWKLEGRRVEIHIRTIDEYDQN